jgi:hypothetical protein
MGKELRYVTDDAAPIGCMVNDIENRLREFLAVCSPKRRVKDKVSKTGGSTAARLPATIVGPSHYLFLMAIR